MKVKRSHRPIAETHVSRCLLNSLFFLTSEIASETKGRPSKPVLPQPTKRRAHAELLFVCYGKRRPVT